MVSIPKKGIPVVKQNVNKIIGSESKFVEAEFGTEAKKTLEKRGKKLLYTIPESDKVAANTLPLNLLAKRGPITL